MDSLYYNVYVEFAAKSPMFVPGEMVTSNLFRTKVDQFIKGSSLYNSTAWLFDTNMDSIFDLYIVILIYSWCFWI